MQRLFKNLSLPSRIALIVCAAALVGCLVMMAVTPARSALVYQSNEYEAEIQQTHIGVALTENGKEVSGDNDLLKDQVYLLGGDDTLKPGKTYPEALAVKNISSDMDEYVRLTVRKYWAIARSRTPRATMPASSRPYAIPPSSSWNSTRTARARGCTRRRRARPSAWCSITRTC